MKPTNLGDFQSFDAASPALDRIFDIYERSVERVNERLRRFREGERGITDSHACYPYLKITAQNPAASNSRNLAYGNLPASGTYGTTLTDPSLFRTYYEEQIGLLLQNHPGFPVQVGTSNTQIPLPYAAVGGYEGLDAGEMGALRNEFVMPDLARINDSVANGTYTQPPDTPSPLALFNAERVDYSLSRLRHYTGTNPEHFQQYILFTNYQRYVDGFIAYAKEQISTGNKYRAFVEPGNVITP